MTKSKQIILGDKRGYRSPSRISGRGIVTLIIGFFALSFIFWSIRTINEQSRVKQALVDISRIEHAARLFRADLGRCPDDLDELVYPPNQRRYIDQFEDPWQRRYMLKCPAMLDPGGVEVISGGPDGDLGGKDNISSL
jgi:type II secretory pathway pseudopilin PulG